MKKTKKILSVILSVLIVLSVLPLTAFLSFAAETPTYIASIGIAQDGSSGSTGVNDCKSELSGHTIIDRDLNDGAGGDYVYMGYKTTTDPTKAITGIVFRVGGSPPNSITYKSCTFYLVGGSSEKNTASEGGYIDLNGAAGGDYIYMYVTRDSAYGAPLTSMTVTESKSQSGYETGTNNSGSVIDLNQNAGGKYLYLHYTRFSAAVKVTYHYLTASGERTSSTKSATVKNHLEKVTSVPSVPATVTYDGRTFTFKGWREDDSPDAPSTSSPSATYMTGNKVYRAVYSGNIVLSFDANGGTGAPAAITTQQYINAGSSKIVRQSLETMLPTQIPTHSGKCQLYGWSKNAYIQVPEMYAGGESTSYDTNTTLYAIYYNNHQTGTDDGNHATPVYCPRCGKVTVEANNNHSFDEKGVCICGARDHTCTYTNGFCIRCGDYQPAELKDGYYQITNGGNLFWFAEYINTVDRTANAKLTADINLENRAWTPIGSTGEGNNNFRGHFDGQGYTITGLYAEGGRSGLGFFGEVRLGTVENFTIYGEVKLIGKHDYVGGVIGSAPGVNSDEPEHNGATIRNIISYVNVTLGEGSHGSNRVGGFIGYANHETLIENCAWYGTLDLGPYRAQDGVGGLVGKANDNSAVTIRNCGAYGTIKTSYQSGSYNSFDTIYIGGIVSNSVSSAQTNIENTLWAGNIINETNLGEKAHISAFGTLNGIGSVTNCYVLDNAPYITTNGTHDSYITSVTDEQLASGEVAYKLGTAWGQTIGTDNYPILGGAKVYYGYADCEATEMTYANSSLSGACISYENGFCTVCDSYEPATGSGTESDPYKISNAGQLYWFAAQVNSGNKSICAILTDNIVVNEDVLKEDGSLNEGTFRAWTPIGNSSTKYQGSFDGKGFTVSGLYFNNSSTYYVGLIGYSDRGTIKNTGVIDSYFSAKQYIGAIVGWNSGGNVTNCFNTGSIVSDYIIGGVVGINYTNSTITNCYNTGTLIGKGSVGGVVGSNYQTVENCYNTGRLIISGESRVGGVAADNKGTITHCYNTGSVNGTGNVGGVVGENDGTVTNCYNVGSVDGTGNVGGVAGDNSEVVTNCYYDSTVYNGNAIGYNGDTATNVLGKTTSEFASGEVAYLMQEKETKHIWGQNVDGEGEKDISPVLGGKKVYIVFNCQNEPASFSNTEGQNSGHSYENGFCTACNSYEPATGEGTESDPYKISNAGQLYWFSVKVSDGYRFSCAELTNSITVNTGDVAGCGGIKAEEWLCWNTIGKTSNLSYYKGTFDGKGFTISGLYFNESDTDYVGLFGYVDSGTIKNVGIVNSYLNGNDFVGGVAGYSSGSITNCYYTGSIGGSSKIGGIVGSNFGVVENCCYTGSISGNHNIGGVVGYNDNTVVNCYATPNIIGKLVSSSFVGGTSIGGVVGSNNGAVTNCYSNGSNNINRGDAVGSVVGYNIGQVSHCYYDSTVCKDNAFGSGSGNFWDVEGKTTEEFASGEVAHRMGIGFGQDIDNGKTVQTYPTFTGAKVYKVNNCKNETVYSNTDKTYGHDWSGNDGICDVCELAGFTAVNGAVVNCESGMIFGLDAGITSVDSYINVLVDGAEWEYELGIFDQFGTGTKAMLLDDDKVIAEYTVLIFGDVDGNGWYDANDAFLVNMIVNGLISADKFSEVQQMAADCNHDGVIDEDDVELLVGAGVRINDIDQNSSISELQLQAAYIEYASLIDQSAGLDVESDEDTDDTTTPDTSEPETSDETEELTFSIFIIKIFTFIRKVLNLDFSFIIK